jgi:hypothetical protein
VEAFAIAADGSVVYQADQEVNNRVELYHAPLERPVHRLSAPSGENQDVTFFQLAPDGNRVLYATTRPQRLFLTTLDGSIAPVALTGVPLGPNAQPYTLDAGGAHLVFSDAVGLWSLSLDGVSTPIELVHSEPDAHVGGNLLGLADGRVVTWIRSFDWSSELYTVPIDGGAEPQRISAPLPLERALDSALALELAPDGRRTVFAFGRYEVTRLYSVDFVPRSAPVQLAAQCEHSWFRISPDSAWVVFRTVEGLLHSVAIDGSTPPSPIDAVPTTAEVGFSPDGRRVFYLDALRRLHSAPLDGSSAPVLLDGFPEESSVTFDGYRVSPDASRVVYLFEVPGEDGTHLLSAPVDGSAPAIELDPLHRVDHLIDFGADGRIVVQTSAPGYRVSLWSAPADGSAAPTFLASAFIYQEEGDYGSEVEGEYVYFTSIGNGVLRVPVEGHEAPLPLAPGWHASQLEVAGGRAFFIAMPDGQHLDLYSVPGDGSAPPVNLSRMPPGVVLDTRLTTDDGARVVYRRVEYGLESDDIALYATDGDGSTEPVRLTPPLTGWEQHIWPTSFALSADGRTVAFEIDTEDFSLETATQEVFVAPGDGHSAAVVVNDPPPEATRWTTSVSIPMAASSCSSPTGTSRACTRSSSLRCGVQRTCSSAEHVRHRAFLSREGFFTDDAGRSAAPTAVRAARICGGRVTKGVPPWVWVSCVAAACRSRWSHSSGPAPRRARSSAGRSPARYSVTWKTSASGPTERWRSSPPTTSAGSARSRASRSRDNPSGSRSRPSPARAATSSSPPTERASSTWTATSSASPSTAAPRPCACTSPRRPSSRSRPSAWRPAAASSSRAIPRQRREPAAQRTCGRQRDARAARRSRRGDERVVRGQPGRRDRGVGRAPGLEPLPVERADRRLGARGAADRRRRSPLARRSPSRSRPTLRASPSAALRSLSRTSRSTPCRSTAAPRPCS